MAQTERRVAKTLWGISNTGGEALGGQLAQSGEETSAGRVYVDPDGE